MTSALAPEEHSEAARSSPATSLGRRRIGQPWRTSEVQGECFTAELSAVPLEDGGHVIGVFGHVKDVGEDAPPLPHPTSQRASGRFSSC